MNKWKRFIKDDDGFTLIETILALFCVMISLVMLTPCIQALKTMSQDFRNNDDRVAVYQLRCMLAQADTFTLENDKLSFFYRGQTTRLEFDRNRLVRRDGYEIFLENIDDVTFYVENSCFHMNWRRGERSHEALLTCQ